MTRFEVLAIAGLSLSLGVPVEAATFSDQTFNLVDYTIIKSLQIGTATISQTLTGGNPGSAILADYVVPAGPPSTNEFGSVFYLNNNFIYNPGSSGGLSAVTFSIDKNVNLFPSPGTNFGNGQSFLIFQGGNYYLDAVALASTQNVYLTATLTATASDFSLINPSSGAVDNTAHPSFAAGIMEFGFRNGFRFDPQTASEAKILEDNFNVTLTPLVAAVPESETYALMLAGLSGLGFMARRRKKA